MAKLIFLNKNLVGRVFQFEVEKTTVGRGPAHTLVIDDLSVSVDHCEILVYNTEVIVREHSSKNGTFVDGRRVSGQTPVNTGQIIRFGTVEARLELGPEDEIPFDGTSDLTAVHLHNQLMQKARMQRPVGTMASRQGPLAVSRTPAETLVDPLPAPAPQGSAHSAPPSVTPSSASPTPIWKRLVLKLFQILGCRRGHSGNRKNCGKDN